MFCNSCTEYEKTCPGIIDGGKCEDHPDAAHVLICPKGHEQIWHDGDDNVCCQCGESMTDKGLFETNEPAKIETAIIRIAPDLDPAVFALTEQIDGLVSFAEQRVVQSTEDMKAATEDLGLIGSLTKTLESKQKEYTGPIDQHLKDVRAKFKVFIDPLKRADQLTRSKMLAYRAQCDRKAREAAEIQLMKEEAARREAALNNIPPEPIIQPPVPAAAPARVHTEVADAGIVRTRRYRVINFALLTDEYKIENSVLLNKVTKAGIPSIPGIEFYFEEGIRVTR